MDPITHFLTGACLGRAGLNRKTALATLTLTLAAEAPDIDVLWYIGGSVTGFAHHRGFTHTLLGAPFMAGLVVAGVYGIHRLMRRFGRETRSAPRWKLLYLYALFACLLHILMDYTNNYGVRPFAPFSPKWYSWDIVFISDPWLWLALFAGLAMPALAALVTEEIGGRKGRLRGRGGAIFALAVYAALVLVRDFEHRKAVNALGSLTYRDEEPLRVSAFPSFWNPFLWNGVVETRNLFYVVEADSETGVVDPHNNAVFHLKPPETPVSLAAKHSYLGRVYLDWAQYPLVDPVRSTPGGDTTVQFEDLRFSYIQGMRNRRSPTLAGYVVITPNLQVKSQYIGEIQPD